MTRSKHSAPRKFRTFMYVSINKYKQYFLIFPRMAQKRNQLSKSTLIRSIQCPKSLYLYTKHYDLRDPVSISQQQVFDRGIRVGKLAQRLFPGGRDMSPPNAYSYDASIAATKALVLTKYPVIYEA